MSGDMIDVQPGQHWLHENGYLIYIRARKRQSSARGNLIWYTNILFESGTIGNYVKISEDTLRHKAKILEDISEVKRISREYSDNRLKEYGF